MANPCQVRVNILKRNVVQKWSLADLLEIFFLWPILGLGTGHFLEARLNHYVNEVNIGAAFERKKHNQCSRYQKVPPFMYNHFHNYWKTIFFLLISPLASRCPLPDLTFDTIIYHLRFPPLELFYVND